jgi:hypothetical protein
VRNEHHLIYPTLVSVLMSICVGTAATVSGEYTGEWMERYRPSGKRVIGEKGISGYCPGSYSFSSSQLTVELMPCCCALHPTNLIHVMCLTAGRVTFSGILIASSLRLMMWTNRGFLLCNKSLVRLARCCPQEQECFNYEKSDKRRQRSSVDDFTQWSSLSRSKTAIPP